jgi:hypothetical protein
LFFSVWHIILPTPAIEKSENSRIENEGVGIRLFVLPCRIFSSYLQLYGSFKILHLIIKMPRLVLFILISIVYSCNSKSESLTIETDESQILNITLDKVIGSDTTWRYHLKLPPPSIPVIAFTDKVDSVEYLKTVSWQDSALKVLDTASLFVAVSKENGYIAESHINTIESHIANNKSDTLFNTVLQILCNQNLNQDTIDVALLKTKYNFKIFDVSTAPNDGLRRIGTLRFSKIAFNETKNRACIYTRFSCGEFCGNGDIHFFVKKNGKWAFVKTWELWRS